jgi:hypothetical protein
MLFWVVICPKIYDDNLSEKFSVASFVESIPWPPDGDVESPERRHRLPAQLFRRVAIDDVIVVDVVTPVVAADRELKRVGPPRLQRAPVDGLGADFIK